MEKEQSASLNPSKISGNCGRLMCCLKYEQEVYEDKIKKLPKVGAIVKTPDGKGTVVGIEVLKEKVKVQIKNEDINTYKDFNLADIKIIKNGTSNEENNLIQEDIENIRELEKLEQLEKEDEKNIKHEDDEY